MVSSELAESFKNMALTTIEPVTAG